MSPSDQEAIELIELNQRLNLDGRSVKPEEKKRFLELANSPKLETWARTILGGEDVLPNIIETRERLQKRLKKAA